MADDVTNITAVEEEVVEPFKIRDKKTGEFKYLLEFDRDTVKFAETRGLKPQVIEGDLGATEIEELFFCAFRKHHSKISKAETDRILNEEVCGLTVEQLLRLCKLFELPYTTLIVDKDKQEKNSTATME